MRPACSSDITILSVIALSFVQLVSAAYRPDLLGTQQAGAALMGWLGKLGLSLSTVRLDILRSWLPLCVDMLLALGHTCRGVDYSC